METSQCQVCGSPVEKGTKVAVCPACETPAHPECWEYNGGCTTYACRESPAIKNSAKRAPAPVYIDGRARHHERRAAHGASRTPAQQLQSFFGAIGQAVGWAFALFMFFGFVAGFIEGASKGARRPRRSSPPMTRARTIGNGTRDQQMYELLAMAKQRSGSLEDVRAAGTAATWSTDPEIRMLATEALIAVEGHESTRQSYLCELIGSRDEKQRKLAMSNIPDMGRPTQHAVDTLIRGLSSPGTLADDAMLTLERVRPARHQIEASRISVPPEYRQRVLHLAK